MSLWSGSIYSDLGSSRTSQSNKTFLEEIDACLYEGEECTDPRLTAECADWSKRFPHMRVVGHKCGHQKVDPRYEQFRSMVITNLVQETVMKKFEESCMQKKPQRGKLLNRPTMEKAVIAKKF